MGKHYPPPRWAMKTAAPGEREDAVHAHERGTLKTNWDYDSVTYAGERMINGPPKDWTKAHGWPTPWWSFRSAFLTKMLENDENFDLAVTESGVELYFAITEHTLSENDLKRLDALYEETEERGALGQRPTRWGELVEELREIRRAVEAGVAVKVEGKTLKSSGSFYNWAHGRYHALEDGYDSWIGDDES